MGLKLVHFKIHNEIIAPLTLIKCHMQLSPLKWRHLVASLHSLASRCEGKFVTLSALILVWVLIMYFRECQEKLRADSRMHEKVGLHWKTKTTKPIFQISTFFNLSNHISDLVKYEMEHCKTVMFYVLFRFES